MLVVWLEQGAPHSFPIEHVAVGHPWLKGPNIYRVLQHIVWDIWLEPMHAAKHPRQVLHAGGLVCSGLS